MNFLKKLKNIVRYNIPEIVLFSLLILLYFSQIALSNELTYDELFALSWEDRMIYCQENERINNPDSPCYETPAGASVGFDGVTIFPDDTWFSIITPIVIIIFLYFFKCEVDLWYFKRQKRIEREFENE